MTSETEFRWTSAGRSDAGLVRQHNEDAFLDQPQQGLWAVADGMGGHAYGELASRMIVDALQGPASGPGAANPIAQARERLQAVNRQLRDESIARGVPIIGSTVVALLASGTSCTGLWAGDSRIYLFRNGSLKQLTRDHSQVEELRAMGGEAAEASGMRPARNLITRAVGAADTLVLDELELAVEDDDVFLLCSDGLSNEVSEESIAGALLHADCRRAANELVELAIRNGGRDNVTAVVVHAEDVNDAERTVVNPAL